MFLPWLPFIPGGTVDDPPSAFLPGWGYRAPMRVPGAVLGGTLIEPNVPLWFDETHADLKSVANGGLVESDDGWDITFYADNHQKLAYELEIYDPVAGRVAGWLLITYLEPTKVFDVWWYIGNGSLSGPEADPEAAWAPFFGSWRMPDGVDVSGRGRDLTMVGTVTGTPINGMPTADLNTSTDYGGLDNPRFFDGARDWTVMWWCEPSQDGMFVRYGGSTPGTAAHSIWRESGRWQGGYKLTTGENPVLSGPEGSATGGIMHVAYTAQQDVNPSLYRDGDRLTSTMAGSPGSGTVSVGEGYTLRMGANPGSNPGAVQGARTRIIHAARAFSPELIKWCYRNQSDPRSTYGLGSNEEPTGDRSPAMAPVYTTCEPGGEAIIQVAGSATDPDNDDLTPSVTVSPSQGTATAGGSTWAYRANESAAGYDRFLAQVASGSKTASAAITVRITLGGGTAEGETPIPAPESTEFVSSMDGLRGAISRHTGDNVKRIVCRKGSYPGSLTVDRTNIQVWSEELNDAVFSGPITLSGPGCILARARITRSGTGSYFVRLSGNRSRVHRCLIDGQGQARNGDDGTSGTENHAGVDITADDCEVDGCEITGTSQGIEASHTHVRWKIFRNWLHDQGGVLSSKHAWVYVGSGGPVSARASIQGLFLCNRLESASAHQQLEIKGSDCRIISNTHKGTSPIANVYTRTGDDNYYALNWGVGNSVLGLAGRRNIAVRNHGRLGVRGGSITPDQFDSGEKGIMIADGAIVVAHDGIIDLGWNQGSSSRPPIGTIIEDASTATITRSIGSSTYTTRARTIPIPTGLFRELRAPDDVGQRWS
jgi:hypothetical protein